MKRHHWLGTFGMMFIVVGLVALIVPVIAQEGEGASVPPPPEVLSDFYDLWVESPHADVTAEAFNHWNEDDPQEVSTRCATCHTTSGYLDFVGQDGSEAGVVDVPHPVGQVVTCDACHNEATINLESVTFPSGVTLDNVGAATRCMICHQGRASGVDVVNALEAAELEDMNTVDEDLRFINIHYYAAASSLYGGYVNAGYEFEGERYQLVNNHVEGYTTCVDCHNPHTLELELASCASCHEDADDIDGVREIRMNGSLIDYDGDGDIDEPIREEIETLQGMLLEALQMYSEEVIGTEIVYDSSSYPYWFDGDGERFASFTGNMEIATYNYQVSLKDPGGYAHNPKYHIELLYDTIAMLNENISDPIDLSSAHRNDPGHFDATDEPWRHWDEDGEVSGRCSKCHTSEGLPFFLEHGVTISFEPSESMECSTCHNDVENISEGELYISNEVEFPSGAVVSYGEEEPANLCINCHQGRESSVSVMNHIASAGVGDDDISEDLRFRNPHYFAAGATQFGSEAMGGYQYEGMDYTGRFPHARRTDTCTGCHDPHALELDVLRCGDCHDDVETMEDVRNIRLDEDFDPVDYDGDGSVEEPIREEIASYQDALLAAIEAYAADNGGAIVYNPDRYPYWFTEDGERYAAFTPRLVRSLYNYTWSQKDPGAYAHNADYVMQLMYDSLMDIGGEEAVAGFTRPPVIDYDE